MLGLETIALLVTLPLLAFFVVLSLFRKNTEKEARRNQAAEGACRLKSWGLVWAPKLLSSYSTGDYIKLVFDVRRNARPVHGQGRAQTCDGRA